jgi:threonyl-tRNA synthetase
VYRYERSGLLHGMLRVRGFTQDDAHVFCTPEQVPAEIGRLLDLVDEMLTTFGYPYTIELSTRPEHSMGTAEQWTDAQDLLARVLRERGQAFEVDEGGGAFYGPKLDFKLIDAIGRKWQGPTVQLDFNLPERFELEFIGADNTAHRPVMLHRVLVGSMERFVGGLIEHYAGNFPVWLAPEQVRVLPISEDVRDYAADVTTRMTAHGIRAHLDDRSETLKYRVREGAMLKIPYLVVVGKREAEQDAVAVRVRGSAEKAPPEVIAASAFIDRVRDQIARRALEPGGVSGS